MRQVLSWRFLAAVAAIAVLASGALLLQSQRSGLSSLDSQSEAETRRVDVVSLVTAIQAPDFQLSDQGRVGGTLILDIQVGGEPRQIQAFPGTPGVVECQELTEYSCAVLAQALGDTISWFALVPMNPGQQFQFSLPAITDLQDGYAHLVNGWEVPYAPEIDRSCDPDVANFAEFISKHRTEFTSIYDLREQAIVAVGCPRDVPVVTAS